MPRRRRIVPALLIALVTGPAPARADESENYQRLRAIPRERRVALAENLARFDKLDRAEQAEIRKLDARLAGMDPVDQARYRGVLRRYHLWVNGLTDDQKRSLKEAPTLEARLALARQLRLDEAQAVPSGLRLAGLRTGYFGLVGPYEMAHLLRVWNKLPPARKAEVERQRERGRMFASIKGEAKSAGVRFVPFPAAAEATYAARIDGDAPLKALLGGIGRGPDPAPRKGDASPRKADALWRRSEIPFAQFLYFEEHRPKPVLPRNLQRFAEASPDWLRSMTDPLSPDDARDYLTILYRLLYPEPAEMPDDPKLSPAQPTRPKPAPAKATNTGPF